MRFWSGPPPFGSIRMGLAVWVPLYLTEYYSPRLLDDVFSLGEKRTNVNVTQESLGFIVWSGFLISLFCDVSRDCCTLIFFSNPCWVTSTVNIQIPNTSDTFVGYYKFSALDSSAQQDVFSTHAASHFVKR